MSDKIDSRDIFLKGKNVYLKALTRDDVINSGWYGWFNDEDLCKTLQKHYYPNTMDFQIRFWEENIRGAIDKIQLAICPIDSGQIVGIVSLNNIDYINRKAEFSVVIGQREARNVIIFIEACKLILKHGFYSLNLNRIYGGSISRDLVDMMCRTFNFQEEGIRRQEIYKNGKYFDAYCFGILRDEFPQF